MQQVLIKNKLYEPCGPKCLLFVQEGWFHALSQPALSRSCIKMGVRRVCTGSWDSGTRDEGREDVELEA